MDPRKAYNLLNDHLITGLPLEGLSQAKRTWFNRTIIHTFIAVDNELLLKHILDVMAILM